MSKSPIGKLRLAGTAAMCLSALALAACGSSNSSSTSNSASASASSSSSTSAAASTGVEVKTASGPDGTYLVGPSGRALYLWMADASGKSSCSGACAQAWPPLTTTATPVATGGAMSADLGVITRSDGTKQVTYKNHPLYYFAGDSGPGMAHGQGSDSFGAKWWLVGPSGAAITKHASSSTSGGSWA